MRCAVCGGEITGRQATAKVCLNVDCQRTWRRGISARSRARTMGKAEGDWSGFRRDLGLAAPDTLEQRIENLEQLARQTVEVTGTLAAVQQQQRDRLDRLEAVAAGIAAALQTMAQMLTGRAG